MPAARALAFSCSIAVYSIISAVTIASSRRNLWSGLADEGQLMAYQHDGFFYAMDTYREYEYLNQLWSAKQAPWKVWQD